MRFLLPLLCFLALPAYAEEMSVGLPIRVVIIQCGTQQEAYESCESGEEVRCCPVVDPALLEEEKQVSSLDINEPQVAESSKPGSLF